MFIIKEGDQQETNASHIDTLRDWILAGRVSRSTLVRKAPDGEWMTAGDMPELKAFFQSSSPPPLPLSASPQVGAPVVPRNLRTSRLAIASLVLGILSVPSVGITGIPGLICGILAQRKIRKNPSELKGQGIALAGIIFSGLLLALLPFLAILAGLLLPALSKAKSRAQTISCVNQMKQLALGVRIYSNDHKDVFPMDLMSLSNEVVQAKLLICPGDGRPQVDRNTITWGQASPERISYEYLLPGADESKLDPNEIILRCPIHGNEAHADGSVHQTGAGRRP